MRAATSEGERTAVAAAAAAETAAAAAAASVGEGGGRAAARVVVVLAGDAVVRKTNQAIVITPGIFFKENVTRNWRLIHYGKHNVLFLAFQVLVGICLIYRRIHADMETPSSSCNQPGLNYC